MWRGKISRRLGVTSTLPASAVAGGPNSIDVDVDMIELAIVQMTASGASRLRPTSTQLAGPG
jgi:hypothetical protein